MDEPSVPEEVDGLRERLRAAGCREAAAGGRGPRVVRGQVATGDRFVSSAEDVRALRGALPSALCVEMEGAAVAQVCGEYGVPFAVMRTISDDAREGAAVDFAWFVRNVASRYSLEVVAGFLRLFPRPGGVRAAAVTRRREPARPSAVDVVKPCGIVNHMVMDQSPRLDRVFHALAHPARRAIIRQLAGGERNLSELASPLRMTFPAASKHVRVLERADLVRRRVAGREHRCRLRAEPLRDAMLWTEQFRRNWEARFEALDALLDEMKSAERSGSRQPASRRR